MDNPIKIGITGGIGSGKSYVATIFSSLGVPMYNSDLRSRDLSNQSPIKENIIKTFGDGFYYDGQLDRKKIAKIVFNDTELLDKLNQIIHPVIESDFNAWCRLIKAIEPDTKFILKESAILIETGMYKKMDFNILVTAPEELRIQRVIKRDNLSVDAIKKRINKQSKDINKILSVDYIINNDERTPVFDQVKIIYEQLSKRV